MFQSFINIIAFISLPATMPRGSKNAVEGNKTSKDVAAAAVVDTLPLEGEEQVEGSIEGTKPQEKGSSSSTSQKKTKKKLPAKTSRSNRAGLQFPVGR